MEQGKAKTWDLEANIGKAAPQKRYTCPLAPKWGSKENAIALGLKAASKRTSSTPCTSVPVKCLFLQPCRVGVAALHVPPRRREVYRFVGCEQNKY